MRASSTSGSRRRRPLAIWASSVSIVSNELNAVATILTGYTDRQAKKTQGAGSGSYGAMICRTARRLRGSECDGDFTTPIRGSAARAEMPPVGKRCRAACRQSHHTIDSRKALRARVSRTIVHDRNIPVKLSGEVHQGNRALGAAKEDHYALQPP